MPKGILENNLEIISLNNKVKALETSKEGVDKKLWPTLNAGIEYNVNDYDNEKSTAIKEGMLLSDRKSDETKLSLNLIWSIGNGTQKIAQTKNNIELKTASMQRDKLKLNLIKSDHKAKFIEKKELNHNQETIRVPLFSQI